MRSTRRSPSAGWTTPRRAGSAPTPARVRSPKDKSLASHCTSWRGLGGNTVSERAALVWHELGVAGGGRLVEPLVFVVGLVRDEQSGVVPALDRGGVPVQVFGDLGQGEQAAGAQPVGV